MNNKIKFFKTDNGTVSIQTVFPTINGIEQPMEMVVFINQEGKDIVLNFNKKQANELIKEIRKAVGLLNFMVD